MRMTKRTTVPEHVVKQLKEWQGSGYSATATALALGLSVYQVRKHVPLGGWWGRRNLSHRISRALKRQFVCDGKLGELYDRYRIIVDSHPGISEKVLRLGLGIPQSDNVTCFKEWLELDELKRWARGRIANIYMEILDKAAKVCQIDPHPPNGA